MTTADCPPASGTTRAYEAEYLALRPLIRTCILKFNLEENVDDVEHDLWLQLNKRSERLGTSILERYDPARGANFTTYVIVCVTSKLKKRFVQERQRRKACHGGPVSLVHGRENAREAAAGTGRFGCRHGGVSESALANFSRDGGAHAPDEGDDVARLLERLSKTSHARVSQRVSHAGQEPLSNTNLLRVLYYDGLSIPEAAAYFHVTAETIYGRVRQLRAEPRIRRFVGLEAEPELALAG